MGQSDTGSSVKQAFEAMTLMLTTAGGIRKLACPQGRQEEESDLAQLF